MSAWQRVLDEHGFVSADDPIDGPGSWDDVALPDDLGLDGLFVPTADVSVGEFDDGAADDDDLDDVVAVHRRPAAIETTAEVDADDQAESEDDDVESPDTSAVDAFVDDGVTFTDPIDVAPTDLEVDGEAEDLDDDDLDDDWDGDDV